MLLIGQLKVHRKFEKNLEVFISEIKDFDRLCARKTFEERNISINRQTRDLEERRMRIA